MCLMYNGRCKLVTLQMCFPGAPAHRPDQRSHCGFQQSGDAAAQLPSGLCPEALHWLQVRFSFFLIQKFNCLWNAELQTPSGTRWLSTRFWISSTRRWKSSPSRQKYFFLQIIQWQQMIFSCQVCGNLCPLCSGVEWPAGILLFMTSARKRSYKLSFMSLYSGVRQSGCFVSTGDEGGPWECKSSGEASRI